MFGVIIITFVITALSMTVVFLMDRDQKHNKENARLLRENDGLYKQVDHFRIQEHRRLEQQAYNQGLYDGRQTDTLYRKMLGKYQRGDQITAMLHGEEAVRNTK